MATIRKGDIVELEIEDMAYGGKGVARADGFVVFVRGGVIGDRIRGRIFTKKRNYAEADLIDLISPSKERVEAPCPYFGFCGGCQWQHIKYETQLAFKQKSIVDSISKIANITGVVVNEVTPSQTSFAYRNKMEFSFSDRKWVLPEYLGTKDFDGGFALGLHVPGTYYKVIDVDNCLLQNDTGNRILRAVRQYVKNSGIPAYGLKNHKGFWRFLTLRYSVSEDEWMVNLVTSENRPEIVRPLMNYLAYNFNKIGTIVNNITARKASISTGEKEIVLMGRGFINDSIGDFRFQISANSFFQTNTNGTKKLFETVSRFAELSGNEYVLDLYSGTGTIPVFLSKMASNISGIEISKSAVMDAIKNCNQNNITNCRFICGDTREILMKIDKTPDVIIIDPPRAGMHKDVLSRVLEMAPERIVYVSCNPTTMARDLAIMAPKYKISEIQPVDMFPHTYHIESVIKLTYRKK